MRDDPQASFLKAHKGSWVGWLIGWLVGWLVDWLLVGWLVWQGMRDEGWCVLGCSGVVWSGVLCGLEAVFLGKRSVWWPPGPFSLENVAFGGLQGPKHGPVHHVPDPKIA